MKPAVPRRLTGTPAELLAAIAAAKAERTPPNRATTIQVFETQQKT